MAEIENKGRTGSKSTKKVALVTGGSSGIGEATAVRLAAAGFTTYAAARRVDKMNHLKAKGIRVIDLDVTEEASMKNCVNRIIAENGRIDVLVNGAGYGSYGPIEEVPLEEGIRQFEVNLFGAVRLIQLVLPHMRKQHYGKIVNITSMGGRLHTPFGGWYHATKFALEGMSDCLRWELKDFGIDVVIIEPGGIKTEWSGIAADNLVKTSQNTPYSAKANQMANTLRNAKGSDPEVIAEAIEKAVTARKPRTRYVKGYSAKPLLFLHAVLPDRSFDRLLNMSTRQTKG